MEHHGGRHGAGGQARARRAPAQVEVGPGDRQAFVEAQALERLTAGQQAGGADGEHLALGVVLSLVVLAPLQAGLAPAGPRDGHADLEQPAQVRPLAQLRTEERRLGVRLGGSDEVLQRVGRGRAVVVEEPDQLVRLAGDGLEPGTDRVGVPGASRQREDRGVSERLPEETCGVVGRPGVDREDAAWGVRLLRQAAEDERQPAATVVAHHEGRHAGRRL